jgi:mersacidin/lichenicidin family type 2 lantibiotic
MTANMIVRAWKDPLFRSTLTDAELSQLPVNPVGLIELEGTVLDVIGGGHKGHDSKDHRKKSKSSRSRKSKSSRSRKSHKSYC